MQIHRIDYVEESRFWPKAIAIISLLLTLAIRSFAQDFINLPSVKSPYDGMFLYPSKDGQWYAIEFPTFYESTLEVDSVAYEGSYENCDKCDETGALLIDGLHRWSHEESESSYIISVCAVNHDSRGCPDTWNRYWRICKDCLRKG